MADQLSCTEAEELLAVAALGVLPRDDSAELAQHMLQCRSCRDVAIAYQRVAVTLPESLDLLEPSAELRRRLLAAVYSASGELRPRRRRLHDAWQRVPRWRAATFVAAGAIAAAAVLGVWGATRSSAPGSPSQQTFAVMATTYAPAAHGELAYDASASRAVLTVSGLPATRAANGQPSRVYEIWLMPRAGAPVAAAFLAPTPNGDTWTAVLQGNLASYKSVAATLEAEGGVAQPTGPEAFSVALHP